MSAWSALGAAIVHFLWEGALIGLVAWVLLDTARDRSAATRSAIRVCLPRVATSSTRAAVSSPCSRVQTATRSAPVSGARSARASLKTVSPSGTSASARAPSPRRLELERVVAGPEAGAQEDLGER